MAQVVGIFVIGASSTGKTTLCRALEQRLKLGGITVVHIKEVARTVMREQGFSRETVGTLAMQRAIMQAQIEAEENALQKISQIIDSNGSSADQRTTTVVLICDRCAVDPVVYATMKIDADEVRSLKTAPSFKKAVLRYGGHGAESQVSLLATAATRLRPVVILAGGVKEWQRQDDGVRSLYDPFGVTDYFRATLQQLGMSYSELGEDIKDLDERVDRVLDISGLGFLKDIERVGVHRGS
jgi:nicotinamide riboside kinase